MAVTITHGLNDEFSYYVLATSRGALEHLLEDAACGGFPTRVTTNVTTQYRSDPGCHKSVISESVR
jgi:hypothetical protein